MLGDVPIGQNFLEGAETNVDCFSSFDLPLPREEIRREYRGLSL